MFNEQLTDFLLKKYRINHAFTIGKDTNGDGIPDKPLRYEISASRTVIEFPLGFCPGDTSDPAQPQINFECVGEFGVVIKEWEVVTRVQKISTFFIVININSILSIKAYPHSASNLSPFTKQVEVDFYDWKNDLINVERMTFNDSIKIVIERLKLKDPNRLKFQRNQSMHAMKLNIS